MTELERVQAELQKDYAHARQMVWDKMGMLLQAGLSIRVPYIEELRNLCDAALSRSVLIAGVRESGRVPPFRIGEQVRFVECKNCGKPAFTCFGKVVTMKDEYTISDVKYDLNGCGSGWLCRIEGGDAWLDSSWFVSAKHTTVTTLEQMSGEAVMRLLNDVSDMKVRIGKLEEQNCRTSEST